MNIVIPMVGLGKRFSDLGFIEPKPLIKVKNKEIIKWTIESLNIDGNYIFITRKYENKDFNIELEKILKNLIKNPKILSIDYLTRGAAESVLISEDIINTKEKLLVTNCDQYTDWESEKKDFLSFCFQDYIDGCVTTYDHIDPDKIELESKTPYSFIKTDNKRKGLELSEKIAISKNMLNGIHYWKHGSDFVSSAKEMIKKNITYNNEFYVSLTYNEMIKEKKYISYYKMKEKTFCSLGTPEDVENFKKENL